MQYNCVLNDCNSADISLLTTGSGTFRVAILGCAAHANDLNVNCHVVHSATCPVDDFGLPRVRVSMTPADALDTPPVAGYAVELPLTRVLLSLASVVPAPLHSRD